MERRAAAGLGAAVLLLAALPAPLALAHGSAPPAPSDLWTAWSLEPLVLLGLALAAGAYAWGLAALWRRVGAGRGVSYGQAAAFAGGIVALVLALVSPLDALSAALFAAHMTQHLLLIQVAAPLLVAGAPLVPSLWALPAPWRRALGRAWRRAPPAAWRTLTAPLLVWALHAGALWAWHLPGLYQAALADERVHALEHACLLGSALLFWWVLPWPGRHGRLGYGTGVLYVLLMTAQSSALGILLAFARAPWYPAYASAEAAWGIAPLDDQQVAGLIMWVPSAFLYLGAVLGLLAAWSRAAERPARAGPAAPAPTGSAAPARPRRGAPA